MRYFPIIMIIMPCFTHGSTHQAPITPVVRISKIGLANHDAKNIYKEGNYFRYQENGTCVIAGKTEPCMQWGYELSWSSVQPGTKMKCIFNANQPAKIVDSLSASPTDEFIYQEASITFTNGFGKQFLPSSLQKEAGDKGVFIQQLKCVLDNTEVINSKFSINFD